MSDRPQTPELPFPIPFLILDALGCLLVAGGVLVLVSEPERLPDFLQWASGDGLWLLISGMALMLPMLVFILRKALERKASRRPPGS